MAGRKQHFIQRLLLKGFASDPHRDRCHVWVYRQDGNIFSTAMDGYGAERDFYGNPRESDLDSQVTDIESDRFNEFQNELRHGQDRKIEANQAAAFAIHVFLRSKNLRSMIDAGLKPLMARVREIFQDDEVIEKFLVSGLRNDPAPLLKVLDMGDLPPSLRAGFGEQIAPMLPALVRTQIKAQRAKIHSYLDGAVARVGEFVAKGHRQTVQDRLQDFTGTRHAQLVALQWKIVTVNEDLILGDSVVFVELADRTFKPVTEPNDDLVRVWLPIASKRVLVGSSVGHNPGIDAARVNLGAAACSFDAFCAKDGPEKHGSLISHIRTSTFSLNDEAIERIAQAVIAKSIS